MQHLFQSNFLQALGYAITNSVWQTALIWVVYFFVTSILALSASAKYRLATIAQCTGFIWFLVTCAYYYSYYSSVIQTTNSVKFSQNLQNRVSASTTIYSSVINWMIKGELLLPYVSFAYLILIVFLCFRWFWGYRQTQQTRTNGIQKMPAQWRLFVTKITSQLAIKKNIQIYLSTYVTTPLTIGFFKPVILIPIASINHLTIDQLEAVLLHEIAHIKRHDYLINLLLSGIEIILFFNPFTQLLSKIIHKERENSCDDWVLQFKYNAAVYANALLRIAYLQSVPDFAMAVIGKKKNELLVRIQRILQKKETRYSYQKQLLSFVILTGILFSITWLNPIATANQHSLGIISTKNIQQKQLPTISIEPIAVSVDNPLFNPVFFLATPLKEEPKKILASAQKVLEKDLLINSKEPARFIELLTPVIVNAITGTAMAMNEKDKLFSNEMSQLSWAKHEPESSLHNDSIFTISQLREKFQTDLKSSLKKMETEINNAKLVMDGIEKSTTTFERSIDKIKSKKDIQKAMDATHQLINPALTKWVMDVTKIPELLFNQKEQFKHQTEMEESNHLQKQVSPIEIEIPVMPNIEIGYDLDKINSKNDFFDTGLDLSENASRKLLVDQVSNRNKVMIINDRIMNRFIIATLRLDQISHKENFQKNVDKATLLRLQKMAVRMLKTNKSKADYLFQ